MDSFGPHNETYESRVLIPCSCLKHRVIHGDSQKVPRRYVTQLGWMSPAKKLAVWCDYCYLSDSEFCIFTTSVGRISHYRRDGFFSHLTLIPSLFRDFSSTLFSVLANCMSCRACTTAWHSYNHKPCEVVFDHLSLFIP